MNPLPSADPDRTNLRESSADPSATVDASADSTRPKLPPPPAGAPTIPGYVVTGEIATGGMGKVYSAHHLTLDREVAIKTLLPGANAERFVTESKITAKLPHPNIPPVHELGTLADGTPFLAMKYVRGGTLSAQLKARPNPQQDLPRFLQIFEQIAQAVGFAHSRGIIHRDLKPLNVMVGEFGEVQVMDWGLARVLASGGREPAVSAGEQPPGGGHSPEADLTRAGAVMGTPGYMAPEQARGESVDARADVFALGAVLANILTGQPAFVGTTALETITKAATADLSEVLARLDSCGADVELVAITRRCLSADRDARPTEGRTVASEVAAYRAGVEARLRQAETDRAAAVVREGEQRKRRRVIYWSVGVAGGILLVGTLIIAYMAVRAMGAERYTRVVMSEATENDTIRLFDDLNAGRVNTAPGGTVQQEAEDHLQRIDGHLRYLSGWDEGEHPVFGLAQSNLGWVLAEQGRYAEAHPLLLAGYEREMRRYRGLDPLARQHRELLRLNLAAARVEWAYRLAADSKAEEVHMRLAGELPVLLPQVDFNRPPGWVLQWRHLARAQAQHRSGATDDALDTLAGIATTTEDPPELAYALSAAYATIGADDPRDREPTAQAAVRHIRRAGESGFRDVTMLKTDSAFDRLRGRGDFRLVEMEIEKKAPPRADK